MNKITKIQQQKNNAEKISIFIDDIYSFSISKNGFINESLYVGKKLLKEDINEIKKNDLKELIFLQIINIFSYGLKTEYEFKNKIRKKKLNEEFDEDLFEICLELAITKAKDYKYINDDYYVKNFIEYKIKQSQGKKKIQQQLIQKGISYEFSEKYFTQSNIVNDLTYNCYKLAEKKLDILNKKKLEPYLLKQKLFQYLIQRGFSYEEIQESLNKLLN